MKHIGVSPGRKSHRYSDAERLTICLLKRLFAFDLGSDYARVFNDVHANEVLDQGHGAVPSAAIVNQLRETKNSPGPYTKFSDIFQSSSHHVRRVYAEQVARIEDAAFRLEFTSTSRPTPPVTPPSTRSKYKHKNIRGLLSCPEMHQSDSEDDDPRHQRIRRTRSAGDLMSYTTPSKRPRVVVEIPQHPAHRSDREILAHTLWHDILGGKRARFLHTKDAAGNKISRHPVIVFRHWTPSSGLQSRLRLPQPPTGMELKRYAKSHLDVSMSKSPFISVSRSFRAVVRRAVKSLFERTESYITIIDLATLYGALRQKYSEESIHLVKRLSDQLNVKGQGWYSGQDEWLVFDSIPECARIATFNSRLLLDVKRDHLLLSDVLGLYRPRQVLRYNNKGNMTNIKPPSKPYMNRQTGELIRQFLVNAEVPDTWKEVVAAHIAKRFQFKLVKSSPRSYVIYMAGVFDVPQDLCDDLPSSDTDETDDDTESEFGSPTLRSCQAFEEISDAETDVAGFDVGPDSYPLTMDICPGTGVLSDSEDDEFLPGLQEAAATITDLEVGNEQHRFPSAPRRPRPNLATVIRETSRMSLTPFSDQSLGIAHSDHVPSNPRPVGNPNKIPPKTKKSLPPRTSHFIDLTVDHNTHHARKQCRTLTCFDDVDEDDELRNCASVRRASAYHNESE